MKLGSRCFRFLRFSLSSIHIMCSLARRVDIGTYLARLHFRLSDEIDPLCCRSSVDAPATQTSRTPFGHAAAGCGSTSSMTSPSNGAFDDAQLSICICFATAAATATLMSSSSPFAPPAGDDFSAEFSVLGFSAFGAFEHIPAYRAVTMRCKLSGFYRGIEINTITESYIIIT